MLKNLQAKLQQYVNRELPDVQGEFRRGRGNRDQIANIHWIVEKAREFQKNTYFCFIDYAKAFVWITTNWKIFKEMEIPDHLSCLLRNLYAGQEATVRTRHRTMDWFKTGKGVHQGCILSPAYSHFRKCLWKCRSAQDARETERVSPSLLPVMLKDVRNKEPARMEGEMELEEREEERGQRNR